MVDDEPNILRGIAKTLEDAFSRTARVLTADHPAQALRAAREETVHILITDMAMPQMSGGELIERVLQLHPACRCVLLTAYKDFDLIYKYASNSNVTYLLKIEEEEVLLDTVRRYAGECGDGSDFERHIQFTATDDGLIRSLEEYIVAHVTEELSVNRLADLLGLHSSYLSRCYKSATGRNISAFISHSKMEKAKQLLGEGRLTITEISAALGFEGASYFITFFKKHSGGVTPKQYRIAQSPVGQGTAGKSLSAGSRAERLG